MLSNVGAMSVARSLERWGEVTRTTPSCISCVNRKEAPTLFPFIWGV